MSQYSHDIIYDGKTYNNDCFTVCKYKENLNEVLEFLIDSVNTCPLDLNCLTLPVDTEQTLPNVLQAVIDKTCLCQVKVSETDLCCDYLTNKLTSSDSSLHFAIITDGDGCETIDITVNSSSLFLNGVLLADNNILTTTVAATLHQYSVSPATLVLDGDSLFVDTYVSKDNTNPTANPVVTVEINGNNVIGSLAGLILNGVIATRVKIRVIRVSSTSVYVLPERVDYVGPFIPQTGGLAFIPQTFVVGDLNLFPLNIQVVVSNPDSTTITNDYLIIDKLSA